MKYKVGDKIKVRSDLEKLNIYGGWHVDYRHLKESGKIMTIRICYSDFYDLVENNGVGCWTDEMFEDINISSKSKYIRLELE